MKSSDNNQKAFFALIRAGLWEEQAKLLPLGDIDFNRVYRISEEQSVIGIVAAGIEHVTDVRIPKEVALEFAGYTLQMEQQNTAMNCFIGELMDRMNVANVNAILIKGQGVAQCYERPLWRANGDVDLLLDEENYHKAKEYLFTVAQRVDEEDNARLHLGMTIDNWIVELHGTLRTPYLSAVNKVVDGVQEEMFRNNLFRVWNNNGTEILLPSVNEDTFFVFSHILQHFFGGGIGLRQICDWCRLLWTYHLDIDTSLLEKRLKAAGIMSEWLAFAALAVEWLGMPSETIPLYSPAKKWKNKANRILSFIMETGNFGHNRDTSYYKEPYVIRKAISLWRYTLDSIRRLTIFPLDTTKVWCSKIRFSMVGIAHTVYENGKMV